MRKIEQYPDKALRPILISIVESLENEGVSLDDLLEDYEEYFIKHVGILKLQERYEPATTKDLLKIGVMGFLQSDGHLPKPIKVSREVEVGKIVGNKNL